MADYIDRKDIDVLLRRLNDIVNDLDKMGVTNVSDLLKGYYDQSDMDIVRNRLQNNLNTLDTSLTNLNDALVDFNAELINFDEDNENLDEDLSKLKDNLLSFLDVLGLLDIDLTELQSSLETLDLQINGDTNTDGLSDVLTALQYSIYGEPPYTSANPSPSSLKGMLETFGQQLGDLSEGDNTLALSLSTLSGYLTTFKGSLSELQSQIVSDYGSTIYNSLDEDLIKLVAAITQANDDLDTHQDLIDGVEATIGTSSDTGNSTLYGVLNNTSSVANSASTKANAVENTINNDLSPKVTTLKDTTIPAIKTKMGYDSIGNTSLQSQITSTNGEVNTLNNTTIPNINSKIGNVNVATDGSLQSQITATNTTVNGIDTAIGDTNNITGSIISNISTIKDTTIPDVKSKMGYSNIPSGSTLQGQITSANGNVTDVKNKMGYSSIPSGSTLQGQITSNTGDISDIQGDIGTVPTGQTLQGQITAHNGVIGNTTDTGSDNTLFGLINKTIDDIGGVQDDIGDMTQLSTDLASSISTAQGEITTVQGDITDIQGDIGTVPSGQTLQGQITSQSGEISYIQTDIGTVYPTRDGNLQNQIASIVDMLYSFCFGCKTVDRVSDLNNVDPRWYRVCYVVETDKYYEYTGEDILGGE